MKHLTALFAIFMSGSLLAQSEYCGVGTIWDAESQTCIGIEFLCEPTADLDQDGVVGINDLLAILSAFGDFDLDFDGIYDSVDDCIGAYDECGVCNGPGIPEGYCSCNVMIDALGECGGNCAEDTDGDGVCDNYLGPCFADAVIYDGYSYPLIAIGDQCWFAENLRNTHYSNGDEIPGEFSDEEWSNTNSSSQGAQSIYNNDLNMLEDYGRLYNWYAVDDARGLCPTGWHVPTDNEFMMLESELGMTDGFYSTSPRGTDQGAQLKSSVDDDPSWNGTNTSLFSAVAGGIRYPSGQFELESEWNYLWTSSEHTTGVTGELFCYTRSLRSMWNQVNRSSNLVRNGFSVRCLKD